MKKAFLKILSCFFLFGLFSCDKQLDLAPTDLLIEEAVFADVQTAESALADVYHKLFVASTGTTYVIADASLGYVGLKEGSTYFDYVGGNLAPDNQTVQDIWTRLYQAINVANVFIDKVPLFADYHIDIQKQHVAESKFCRAYAYLTLLCYYGDGALTGNTGGLGVPLQLEPYDGYTPDKLIPRSTNQEVYAQIITDLTEAIENLPVEYKDHLTTRARATKTTAWALLSRVYLYRADYEKCIMASNKVLENPNYHLDPNLLNLFPPNEAGTTSDFSDEVIFGFPVSSNNGNFQFGTHRIWFYNKFYWAADDFINSMKTYDKRRTELIFEGNPNISDPVTRFKKTTFKFNNPDTRGDIIVLRLAEIMLNKAEALTQLNGINQPSVDFLNQIRERSGLNAYSTSDFSSKEDLLTALYRERYIETAFEGRARFDFLRTNRPLRNPDLPDDQKVFPIPQREVDISKGILKQNPGY